MFWFRNTVNEPEEPENNMAIKPAEAIKTRTDFTRNIAILLYEMLEAGEEPVIDFVLRSKYEQNRLFNEGKSKCDGFNKISRHQAAMAMDLYMADKLTGNIAFVWDKDRAEKWHHRWEQLGGKPMISWDTGHFE